MNWWQILIGLILVLIIYFKTMKYFTNRKAIGQKVIIEYFDQNTSFEAIFPKTGIIIEIIKVGERNMFVLELDSSFHYAQYKFLKIVISERHAGYYIGANEEIHVHVLLLKTELEKHKYILTDFDHVVWATIKPIGH